MVLYEVGKVNEEVFALLSENLPMKDVLAEIEQEYHHTRLLGLKHAKVQRYQVVQLLESLLHSLLPVLDVLLRGVEQVKEHVHYAFYVHFSRQIPQALIGKERTRFYGNLEVSHELGETEVLVLVNILVDYFPDHRKQVFAFPIDPVYLGLRLKTVLHEEKQGLLNELVVLDLVILLQVCLIREILKIEVILLLKNFNEVVPWAVYFAPISDALDVLGHLSVLESELFHLFLLAPMHVLLFLGSLGFRGLALLVLLLLSLLLEVLEVLVAELVELIMDKAS